jgi:hypothetical protein
MARGDWDAVTVETTWREVQGGLFFEALRYGDLREAAHAASILCFDGWLTVRDLRFWGLL